MSPRSLVGRLRASILVKIVSPLIGAIAIGILVTAALFGRLRHPGPVAAQFSMLDLILVALILAAAVGILSWLTIRAVTRPLATLSRTARQFAAGSLDAHFGHSSRDEVGQLAAALEAMKLEVRSHLELINSQTGALRESSKRITSARDEERRRLARDLHDGLQQQLIVLRMSLGMAAARVAREPELAETTFAELGAELDRVIERAREVSHDLYPSILRDRGLTSALRSQAGRIPITTRLTSNPDPLPRLPREIESSAYFVLSEAVANVLKHSQASEISIGLTLDEDRLTVTVSDNGQGFQRDGAGDSHGLTNMDDRVRSLGGKLFVTSSQAGTVIRASLPLDPRRAALPGQPTGDLPPGVEQLMAEATSTGAFVGRASEMGLLCSAFEEAASGHGQLLLLSGVAGIGKTRTANELATYATSRGADVLIGRCYEAGGASAYRPWIQVIRSYLHSRDLKELAAALGPGAADVAQIVPELRQHLGEKAEPPLLDPRQARFRLFDSITGLLKNAARQRPVVVILDDLQAADTPSLLLLEFLAAELGRSRLLILGTHRQALSSTDPLARTLSKLDRGHLARTILLRGLDENDVARFMEVVTGTRPSPSLVSAVHGQTEGNPLFVREVVRLLAAEGRLKADDEAACWDLDIPVTIRDAIGRRLERLSPPCLQVLAVASAIGREFSMAILQPVTGLAADRLSAVLEEAIAARILIGLPGDPGTLRFNHGLTRETIYGSLSPRRKRRLHRRIAEACEALYANDIDSHPAELAHHYHAAGRGRWEAKAIQYAARAGDRAASLLAFEEAAGHYERALQALQERRPGKASQSTCCDLLLDLGEARWRAGDTPRAREAFGRAAEIARRLHDPRRLALAAVGYGEGLGAYEFAEGADDALVGLLEEALAALQEWHPRPPDPFRSSPSSSSDPWEVTAARLRVRVLARLAVELYYTDHLERRARLAQEAVDIAKRLGDPSTQLIALYSRFRSVLGPDALDERLSAAEEIVRLAEEIGDRETACRGKHLQLVTLLERGSRAAVDAGMNAWVALVEELRQPLYRWQVLSFQTMIALMEGRFDDAEVLMKEALQISRQGPGQAAGIRFGAQLFQHHWGRGRLEEMEPTARQLAGKYPWLPGWGTGLALIYTELDRETEARAYFEELAAADFADLPRDGNWLGSIALAALVCSYLGDVRRAGLLFDLLAPYEDRCILVHAGALCIGSAATFLGVLAATLGRFDEAQRLFEKGLRRNEELRAPPMIALTLTQHAGMLTSRNGPGDARAALHLLARSLEICETLGMQRCIEVVTDVQHRAESLLRVAGSTEVLR